MIAGVQDLSLAGGCADVVSMDNRIHNNRIYLFIYLYIYMYLSIYVFIYKIYIPHSHPMNSYLSFSCIVPVH